MITLALAVGVRDLVRRGAVVKRLSSVETLGSTDVICTDKTGTLTENRMRVVECWTAGGTVAFDGSEDAAASGPLAALAQTMADCNNARLDGGGDPTEVGMLQAAVALGGPPAIRSRASGVGCASSTSTRS